jgi:hypothetical protein
MQLYAQRATSQTRNAFGLELTVGLDQSPETRPLIPVVVAANAKVQAAMTARQQAENALIGPRVTVRFADSAVDQLLRSTFRACEIADGGSRGAVTIAFFPDGLSPVVAASGAGQVAVTQQFLLRAKNVSIPAAATIREEWIPAVESALAGLTAALQARDSATAALAAAVATEDAAKQDHLICMDKIASEVRGLFPRDRKRVDLIFPATNYRPRSKPEAADTEPPASPEED